MAPPKPLIVVIPGGFHRPSHYGLVTAPLRDLGFAVLSVPLVVAGDVDVSAAATASDDAAALHAQLLPLLDSGADAVVVSHSYGSLVATACIQGQTKAERAARGLAGGVVGAACVAGFAFPARGKSIMGGDEAPPPMPYQTLTDGLLSLTDDAKPLFYSDLPPAAADAAFASLCKFQSYKSLTTFPQFIESEITLPKTYVLCERDQTVPPEFQQVMAQVGGFDKVVKLESGHSPFLSRPEELAKVIASVCEDVSSSAI